MNNNFYFAALLVGQGAGLSKNIKFGTLFFLALILSLFFLNCVLLLAALGLCCCAQVFSSCDGWALLSSCGARGLLITVASLAAEHKLEDRALSPRSRYNLPGPGIQPTSPELAGRLLTPGPPGKSCTQSCWPFPDLLNQGQDLRFADKLSRGRKLT